MVEYSNKLNGTNGYSVSVAALLRSGAAVDAVKSAVDGTASLRAQLMTSELDLATLKATIGDILLVDVDVRNPSELMTLAGLLVERSPQSVIVTSPSLDVNNMRQLMGMGVTDILPQPLARDDIVAALRNAMQRRQTVTRIANGATKKGTVISFLKSGGGVGATSIAVQGACAVARDKNSPSCCVLDLDIQFGTAALILDVEHRVSVLDLVADMSRLDGALLRSAMVRPYDRIDLLAAPDSVLPVTDIRATEVAAVLEIARSEYDYVIVDLPQLWSEWTHAVLATSDSIALVVQLTVPSLRNARRQIEMLRQEHLDAMPLFVIANSVAGGMFGTKNVSEKNAAKALGRKIDFMVPDDATMQKAGDVGQPLSEVRGGRGLEKKIGKILRSMAAQSNRVNVEVARR